MINIPRLDLNEYINGDTRQRKKFSDDIGKAFNETGFVTVTNHGLSKQLIDKLYEDIKALFALPDGVKSTYEIPGLAGQRGYTGKGKETAKGFKQPDLKEFWQIGQTVTDDPVVKNEYPDNVMISEVPSFNATTSEVYKKLEAAGVYLLKAIAAYLGLPENYFDDKVHNGNSILRALHYFPITDPDSLPSDAVRAGAHEDMTWTRHRFFRAHLQDGRGEGLKVDDLLEIGISAEPAFRQQARQPPGWQGRDIPIGLKRGSIVDAQPDNPIVVVLEAHYTRARTHRGLCLCKGFRHRLHERPVPRLSGNPDTAVRGM